MATYLELMAQAEQLMQEAERVRQEEIDDVIADIKEKIQAYGLTAQDLGLAAGGPGRRGAGRPGKTGKSAAAPQYRGPDGQTWAGGRGRKPQWVVDALKSGKTLDDLRIK